MNKQVNWNKGVLVWGLVFVMLAVIVAAVGWILPLLVSGVVFPAGSIIGISAILLLMGFASLAQYAFIRSNPKAGRQMMINEQDERLQLIRARAGQRAYRLSSTLAFAVLIYIAFSGEVGLPTLAGNPLLYSLLAVVGLPYIAYMIIIAIENRTIL